MVWVLAALLLGLATIWQQIHIYNQKQQAFENLVNSSIREMILAREAKLDDVMIDIVKRLSDQPKVKNEVMRRLDDLVERGDTRGLMEIFREK